MPVRSAFPPGSRTPRRHARRGPEAAEHHPRTPEPAPGAPAAEEPFRVASRDRLIPRQRGEVLPDRPRVSYEVILALAIVVACMCGALAVGSAFTLHV